MSVGYMYGPGYGGWGLGWIFMLIFWVIVMGIIVWLIRRIAGGGYHSHFPETPPTQEKEDSAMKILKERYARGDISKDEFESKKKDLMAK